MVSLRDVVMIHDLKKQGLSNTAIAGQLGISRRTVTRRLQQGLELPVYGPRAPKPRLLEPFEAYLRERVTALAGSFGQAAAARDQGTRLHRRLFGGDRLSARGSATVGSAL